MNSQFAGQVVLVTGGGSGIGQAIAETFAEAGATVVIAGRGHDRLAETAKRIEAAGGVADPIPADVTAPDQVARLIDETVARHGRLQVAVNNAGTTGTPGMVAELADESWQTVLATNLTGVWLSMKHQIAHMQAHGGGCIVNIASSIGAHLTIPTMGAYAATKAGVSALTRTAAKEYIRAGIRINAVSPGPVDTPMSRQPGETDQDRNTRLADVLPIGRVAAPAEIAAAVRWLASADASFAVGHDLVLDGAGTP